MRRNGLPRNSRPSRKRGTDESASTSDVVMLPIHFSAYLNLKALKSPSMLAEARGKVAAEAQRVFDEKVMIAREMLKKGYD